MKDRLTEEEEQQERRATWEGVGFRAKHVARIWATLDAARADLAAERDKSRAAEVVIELQGMERDSSIRTLKAALAAEREARERAHAALCNARMALEDISANAQWKPSAWPARRARRAIADLEEVR